MATIPFAKHYESPADLTRLLQSRGMLLEDVGETELWLLIFRQIAKIEVAVRSAIVNIISRESGDMYWMTNSSWFMNAGDDFQKRGYGTRCFRLARVWSRTCAGLG